MTDQFKTFSKLVNTKFNQMMEHDHVFVVNVPDIADEYLKAFKPEDDPIFRERTTHDCSCCRHFVKNIGAILSCDRNGYWHSVWDDAALSELYPYAYVADHMAHLAHNAPIANIFLARENRYGAETTREPREGGPDFVWDHFWADVPLEHVRRNKLRNWEKSRETIMSEARSKRASLARALLEFNTADIEDVLDTIKEGGVYRGEDLARQVRQFHLIKKAYDKLTSPLQRDRFSWTDRGLPGAAIRSSAAGRIFIEMASGTPLEDAVAAYERMVAPENYKRPKALVTPRMVDKAMETLERLELSSAIPRRHAVLSDIAVADVLFVDDRVRGDLKDGVRALLDGEIAAPTPTREPDARDIGVDDFITQIVPSISEMSVRLTGENAGNFVNLTTAQDRDALPLFRWASPVAWVYDGGFGDSIKERVKRAGGKVDAPLRVSLAWSNSDDLDMFCVIDNDWRNRIYFGNKRGPVCHLDVDMNAHGPGIHNHNDKDPVENIYFNRIVDGTFAFGVDQFRKRSAQDVGFTLEVEFEGKVDTFTHRMDLTDHIRNAVVLTIEDGRIARLTHDSRLIAGSQPIEKWGVRTHELVPVHVLMNSPNHIDEVGDGTGNRHWFFCLKNCQNPEPVRGFLNEHLRPDLHEHRRVFDLIGKKSVCEPSGDQLAGVGFTKGRNQSLTVFVKGDGVGGFYKINF
jgi:hypothetical protein